MAHSEHRRGTSLGVKYKEMNTQNDARINQAGQDEDVRRGPFKGNSNPTQSGGVNRSAKGKC